MLFRSPLGVPEDPLRGRHRRALIVERLRLDRALGALLAYGIASGQAPEAIIDAAARRGRAMADAARRWPGGMIAVRDADVEAALRKGALERAARNVEGEWILAGDAAAIRAVGALGRPVPVTGPWHCARMAEAEPEARAAIDALPDLPLRTRWILDGRLVTASEGRAELGRLTAPVHWLESLRALAGARIRVVGPDRVLRSQVRRVLGVEVEA